MGLAWGMTLLQQWERKNENKDSRESQFLFIVYNIYTPLVKILDWWRAKSCQSFIQCSIKRGVCVWWGVGGGLRNGSYTCTEHNACIPRGQTGCKSLCKITSFQHPRGRSIPVHADVVWWEMKDDECRKTQDMSEPGPREGGSSVSGATENKVKNCLRMDLFLLHHNTSWVMSLLSVSPQNRACGISERAVFWSQVCGCFPACAARALRFGKEQFLSWICRETWFTLGNFDLLEGFEIPHSHSPRPQPK